MEAIYPITALAKNQRAVKESAREGIVRITEHGLGAYVFCSEKAYEKSLKKAASEAVLEARLHDAIAEARADVKAGRVYTDVDTFFDEFDKSLQK